MSLDPAEAPGAERGSQELASRIPPYRGDACHRLAFPFLAFLDRRSSTALLVSRKRFGSSRLASALLLSKQRKSSSSQRSCRADRIETNKALLEHSRLRLKPRHDPLVRKRKL